MFSQPHSAMESKYLTPSVGLRRGRHFGVGVAIVAVSVFMFTSAWLIHHAPTRLSGDGRWRAFYQNHDKESSTGSFYPTLPFDELIRQLYEPRKIDVAATSFIDQQGETHSLPWIPRFKEPLGKRLVIVDIDNRPFDKDGELFSTTKWDWASVEHLSTGILSHYMYSIIHGYDYVAIRSPVYEDRHPAWAKVLMTQHALADHDIVVFLDSDAVLPYPELPMEWLMNYWEIPDDIAITMASEPNLDRDRDDKGNIGQNNGFMIVQNLPKTHEIMENWAECPEESRYEGCGKWKWDHNREQDAWSNYLRYEYQDDMKILPCNEANGYPEVAEETGCSGVFLNHHWLNKPLTKSVYADNVMGAWAPAMHKHFLDNYDDIVDDMRGKTLVGSEIQDQKDSE